MHYKTKGTCSTYIDFDLDGDVIRNLHFTNGCNGNLKGISTLVEGMKAQDVIDKLSGTTCDFKNTSCPDQLARALKLALKEKETEKAETVDA